MHAHNRDVGAASIVEDVTSQLVFHHPLGMLYTQKILSYLANVY